MLRFTTHAGQRERQRGQAHMAGSYKCCMRMRMRECGCGCGYTMHSVRFSSNLWHVYPLVPASLLLVPLLLPLSHCCCSPCCCCCCCFCCYLLLGLRLTVVTLASAGPASHILCALKSQFCRDSKAAHGRRRGNLRPIISA